MPKYLSITVFMISTAFCCVSVGTVEAEQGSRLDSQPLMETPPLVVMPGSDAEVSNSTTSMSDGNAKHTTALPNAASENTVDPVEGLPVVQHKNATTDAFENNGSLGTAAPGTAAPGTAASRTTALEAAEAPDDIVGQIETLVQPSRIGSSLKIVLTMSVISLAPAILLMTTSFIRISIVLGLLRQALGAQQIPPNQVTTSLSLFLTLMIMWPVWSRVYEDSIQPYADPDVSMSMEEAWNLGIDPIRSFMIHQIEYAENTDDVLLFMRHVPGATQNPSTYDDVPTQALLPAFVLSELKTAFLLGFKIYLPFLIIDVVVATLTTSMGMVMLPPSMLSLPFKLMLFVLVDGWHQIVEMLLSSFQIASGL